MQTTEYGLTSCPSTKDSSAAAGGTGIRLAGATNSVHIMDVRTGTWQMVQPQGEPPSPRAAHAAAAVGTMVVVQGGIGPAGLASEDLHVLDFADMERPRWHRCARPQHAWHILNGVGSHCSSGVCKADVGIHLLFISRGLIRLAGYPAAAQSSGPLHACYLWGEQQEPAEGVAGNPGQAGSCSNLIPVPRLDKAVEAGGAMLQVAYILLGHFGHLFGIPALS